MVAVPGAKPVTTPAPEISAIPGAELIQAPPPGVELRVDVPPVQSVSVPVIGVGTGLMVTSIVAKHPVGKV